MTDTLFKLIDPDRWRNMWFSVRFIICLNIQVNRLQYEVDLAFRVITLHPYSTGTGYFFARP